MSLLTLAVLAVLAAPPSPSPSPAGGTDSHVGRHLVGSPPVGGIPPTPEQRAEILAAARDVMVAARYCALVTRGPKGDAEARVVDAFPPDERMAVRIGTNPLTRKVEQIRKDPRATLFYFDPKSQGAVTLIGRAEIVADPLEKARWWKEDWEGFYKDGSRGDDYMLLRFVPTRLEIVGHGMVSDPRTWRPVTLELR